MKIKSINIGSFGKLSEFSVEPEGKINVISGSNEAGKSTIFSFVRFILYGFTKRNAKISENDKKKYPSWNTKTCSGSLKFEADGKEYICEREFSGKSMVNKIYDASSGALLFTDTDAGEKFLGAFEETFSKTAHVAQANVSADGMDGLCSAIENIIFSASETVDAKRAQKKLNDYKNELYNKSRKTGLVFETQEKIEQLKQTLISSTDLQKKLLLAEFSLAETQAKLSENKQKLETLYTERLAHKAKSARDLLEKIELAKKKCEDAKSALEEAGAALDMNGFFANAENIELLKDLASTLVECEKSIQSCEKSIEDAQNAKSALFEGNSKKEKMFSLFSSGKTTYEQTKEKLSKISAEIKKYKRLSILFALLIITLPLFFVFSSKKKKMALQLSSLAQLFECESADELAVLLEEYPAYKNIIDEQRIRISMLMREKESAEQKYCDVCERLASLLKAENKEDLIQIAEKTLLRAKLLVAQEEKCTFEYEKASAVLSALLQENDISDLAQTAALSDEEPTRQENIVERDISFYEKANELLRDKEKEYIHQSGLLSSSFADPAQLCGELELEKNKLSVLSQKAQGFSLAIQTIEEALEDMSGNVSPHLSRRAGELFSKITKGKYSNLHVSDKFDLCFTESASSVRREVDYLSTGATDIAYICLRIALVEYLYGEKPPLFFDESFAYLDDDRLGGVLDVLCELANEYQIFIFTCHEREEKYLCQKAKIIKL